MLELNLLPVREARRKEALRQLLMQTVFMLLIVAAVVGFIQSSISGEIKLSNSRVHQMQRDVIDELDRARSGPVRILSELAERIPERLWLTHLATEGKVVLMKGKSLDNDLVALFLRNLAESKYFTNVDLDGTKMGVSKGQLRVVSFSIRAVLVDAKPKKAGKKA